MSKTKLELTWIGKNSGPKLEPRILLESPNKSYHARHKVTEKDCYDNKLIFGDNLLALKALEYEYTGKIKCVFIDPPFNTGQAFEHYDDGVEHSLWLDLMHQRVSIIYKLLTNDGLLWVHLDDSEVHYMKVMLDEIFRRENFVTHISYERSSAAGIGQGGFVVDTTEHILCYKKNVLADHSVKNAFPLELKTIKRYNKYLKSFSRKKLIREFNSKSNGLPVRVFEYEKFEMEKVSLRDYEKRKKEVDKELLSNFDTLFRTNQIQKENSFQKDLVSEMDKKKLYSVEYTPSRGKYENISTELFYYNAELFSWLKDTADIKDNKIVKYSNLTNFWRHEDIPKADIANEGGIKFPRGKKPEQLIKRILELSTEKGDIILDSFGGSGTTGAVAHKMGRKWIMVELGEHCDTHIIPRLKSIIDNTDATGVSKPVNWQGGGGFRYYTLAPSLLEKDKWGNWVVNKQYNPEMLTEAICKLEGFTYQPSDNTWWQQGHSTETDFIYVTTQNLSVDQLTALSEEVGEQNSLLVCCGAFRCKADRFSNLTLKKIPKMVLSRCEWGHDDYSLNVANLPQMEQPESDPEQENLFDDEI